MKTVPLQPARVVWRDNGTPFAPGFDDIYHPARGALAQAQSVFLAGNGLPQRWQGRDHFVVLELGFGFGNNFLATWAAWRDDPQRCARLHYIGIEAHPPTREDLARLARDPALAPLGAELVRDGPLPVSGVQRMAFAEGQVQLLLFQADAREALRELVAEADAVFLDGFAPDRNPAMWDAHLLKLLARRCRAGATAATWSAARAVRDGLAAAGFDVQRATGTGGTGGKRHVTHAVFAPRHVERRPLPGRPMARDVAHEALIVGGGLAGCATAMALAEIGWRGIVIDRHAAPAQEASGNPAGLFHGAVHAADSVYARWNRAAALQATTAIDAALRDGVPGERAGMLRLQSDSAVDSMRQVLAAQGLTEGYVKALDATAVRALADLATGAPAWFYPGGGWVEPAALARWFLQSAGTLATWRGGSEVHAISRRGQHWALLDAAGHTLAESATVVLANAGDAQRLLGTSWPLQRIRGQLSGLPLPALAAAGITAPHVPVAGAGYALPPSQGHLWFGATAQPGDSGTAVRADDHRHNLDRLGALIGAARLPGAEACTGRVGWRCRSRDGLPLIGAVPLPDAATDAVQTRFVPRQPGLFVFTALASRGITWAALGARLVAAWVAGTPAPVEASLLEAVDAARFAVRAARRRAQ
jgi:tRNA 5-methylaminomethyl-2-thiouridine biosynthesis bifunctional protein